MKGKVAVLIVLLSFARLGFAQGFVNLKFENAIINSNGAPQYEVIASNAIPGWTAYIDGTPQTYILYNAASIDVAAVSIQGASSPYIKPIQGNYSVLLQGGTIYSQAGTNAAIGQTGQIPVNALSLVFWGYFTSLGVSFDGQTLSLVTLGSTANYNIYGADISAFAGQTGPLLFTCPQSNYSLIDNIQFSSSPVPEPGELALVAFGALLFGYRRWRVYER